jgi:hypothetical protein
LPIYFLDPVLCIREIHSQFAFFLETLGNPYLPGNPNNIGIISNFLFPKKGLLVSKMKTISCLGGIPDCNFDDTFMFGEARRCLGLSRGLAALTSSIYFIRSWRGGQ